MAQAYRGLGAFGLQTVKLEIKIRRETSLGANAETSAMSRRSTFRRLSQPPASALPYAAFPTNVGQNALRV